MLSALAGDTCKGALAHHVHKEALRRAAHIAQRYEALVEEEQYAQEEEQEAQAREANPNFCTPK